MIFPGVDTYLFLELEWSWPNFVVTWLKIFKPNDSTKKLGQIILSQVTGNGQGHFVTSHLGVNMASVTWATEVSTKWVDQIEQLTDIFEEVSIFVVWLGLFAPFAK